jgi:hypothetical protein
MTEPQSLFSNALDALCRERGGWPDNALPYAVEVIGQGDDPQVLLTGEVPVGLKRDGSPKFGTKQRKYKSAILLSEYRSALAKATEAPNGNEA